MDRAFLRAVETGVTGDVRSDSFNGWIAWVPRHRDEDNSLRMPELTAQNLEYGERQGGGTRGSDPRSSPEEE